MSRGSKAILWPFSELSYDVSGPLLASSGRLLRGGELTLLPSSVSVGPAPPLLRVRPEVEAMSRKESGALEVLQMCGVGEVVKPGARSELLGDLRSRGGGVQ